MVAASSEKGIHPLIAVYNRSCVPVFEKAVEQDEHRLRTVVEQLKVEELIVNGEQLVRNINAPDDINVRAYGRTPQQHKP